LTTTTNIYNVHNKVRVIFPSPLARNMDDFDFDKASSTFPDISLDGEGDFPSAPAPAPNRGFSFNDFDSSLVGTEVKVTGDDEIDKFEDQFPELDVGQVSSVH
jgi:hypothetical protein